MKDDRLYLIHILECIGDVETYAEPGQEAFYASKMMQDAIIRKLQIMAESSRRISEPLKAARTDLDWRRIAGFRNIVVHDYFDVDLGQCWSIVSNELPQLKRVIGEMLDQLGGAPRRPAI